MAPTRGATRHTSKSAAEVGVVAADVAEAAGVDDADAEVDVINVVIIVADVQPCNVQYCNFRQRVTRMVSYNIR